MMEIMKKTFLVQALLVLLKKAPPKGKRLLVICTSSRREVSKDNDVIDDLSPENEERLEPEFSATDNESDEDFNQETEEELLDIPTFLRRQAN